MVEMVTVQDTIDIKEEFEADSSILTVDEADKLSNTKKKNTPKKYNMKKIDRKIRKDKGTKKFDPEQVYKCMECEYISTTRKLFLKHISRHTDERRFKCKECDKTFKDGTCLSEHRKRLHSNERPFKCPHCPKAFVASSERTVHIRVHTGERPFQCKECGKCLKSSGSLQRHVRSHKGLKPFKCQDCDAKFSCSSHLIRHKSSVHLKHKPYVCKYCNTAFVQNSNLTHHIRCLHMGKKDFKCDICEARFTRRKHLEEHSRVLHKTGDQLEFCCDMCAKVFTRKVSLRRHIKYVHLKIQEFECTICDCKFHDAAKLNRHQKSKIHASNLYKMKKSNKQDESRNNIIDTEVDKDGTSIEVTKADSNCDSTIDFEIESEKNMIIKNAYIDDEKLDVVNNNGCGSSVLKVESDVKPKLQHRDDDEELEVDDLSDDEISLDESYDEDEDYKDIDLID